MAIVLSHVHYCPDCEEPWTCVRWMCTPEGDDLPCKACNEKTSEVEPVYRWSHIAGPDNRAVSADGRRASLRTFVSDIRHAVARIFSEVANSDRGAAT